MIYLILKMFVYLLLALFAGAGAGWVLRHIAASKQEEDMQRTLADARARVPQFESHIRSRDEQISRLKEDLKEKDVRINGLVDDVREAELALKDRDRELKQAVAQHETLDDLASDPAAAAQVTSTDQAVSEVLLEGESLMVDDAPAAAEFVSTDSTLTDSLTEKVASLEGALKEARAQAADAMAEAAAAEAEVITLKAELTRAGSSDPAESSSAVADLEARLQQKSSEYDRLARELEQEQRRVTELERERELQNKSLRVLHQQLELEKERGQRVANG